MTNASQEFNTANRLKAIENKLLADMTNAFMAGNNRAAGVNMEIDEWVSLQLTMLNNDIQANNRHYYNELADIATDTAKGIDKAYDRGKDNEYVLLMALLAIGVITMNVKTERFHLGKVRALKRDVTKKIKHYGIKTVDKAHKQRKQAIKQTATNLRTGMTYTQAVDSATKDILSKNIRPVRYKNGAEYALSTHAGMLIDTSCKRAEIYGETLVRDILGINTVIINPRIDTPCPKCIPHLNRVYYDDVFSSLKVTDKKYPLLSEAIISGLYHPRCRDSHRTYVEGKTKKSKPLTPSQIAQAEKVYALEQRVRHCEQKLEEYTRLYNGTLTTENRLKYARQRQWWHMELTRALQSLEKATKDIP